MENREIVLPLRKTNAVEMERRDLTRETCPFFLRHNPYNLVIDQICR